MIDVLGIATDGYLAKANFPLSVASRGYLSTYILVVIDVGKTRGDPGEAFGYLITDDAKMIREKEAVIRREDEEMILMIQIFVMKWV